jgi:hypothetical protein
MSWTRNNLEKFIELYRSFRCLRKIKSDDYKKPEFEKSCLPEVGRFL